jgi:hypothetical protein
LHWEIADVISNRSRGLGGDRAGRSGSAAVSGSSRTLANNPERGKARGKGRSGGPGSLPHCGALATLIRWWEAAEQRCGELSKRAAMAAAMGAQDARILRAETMAAAWDS